MEGGRAYGSQQAPASSVDSVLYTKQPFSLPGMAPSKLCVPS